MKKNPKDGPKLKRLQVKLKGIEHASLAELIKDSSAGTKANMLREALTIYEWIRMRSQEGYTIVAKKPGVTDIMLEVPFHKKKEKPPRPQASTTFEEYAATHLK